MLAGFVVLSLLVLKHQEFYDEGTNLDLGSGILNGLVLYRDLFENHFPFAAYAAAALKWMVGPSLQNVRLAMLFIEAAGFLAAMTVSRLYVPVGLTALLLGLIGPFYFSNLVLYDNFAMICALIMGALCVAALLHKLEPSPLFFALFTVAGAGAFLSSPFAAMATGLAILALFTTRLPLRFVLALGLTIASIPAAYFVYLARAGGWPGFYQGVVTFNTVVYPKFTHTSFAASASKELLLFRLFSADWFRSLDPFLPHPVSYQPPFDDWIFSGAYYRVIALSACVLLAIRRRFAVAVLLYLFVVSLSLRDDRGFHASPFAVFCLFLAACMLQQSWSAPRPWKFVCLALIGCPMLLISISGVRYLSAHAYQSDIWAVQLEAEALTRAAQNRRDVRLGHYPAGHYMHFLTGLRPISRFVDYYPFVVEIARDELDAALRREENIVLAIDFEGSIWNYPNETTLAPELAFAKQSLIKEQVGQWPVYVSPALATGQNATVTTRFGIYHAGEWRLATTIGVPRAPEIRTCHFGGQPGDIPVVGRWDGGANSKVGVYRPSTGEWLLDMTGECAEQTGSRVYHFGGQPGDLPVTGDWNGSGTTKIGIYRPSTGEWLLDDGDGKFDRVKDKSFRFGGQPGDKPLVGDWSGNKITRIGIFRNGVEWILDVSGRGAIDQSCRRFEFGGTEGDVPVVGDWTGDGRSKPGLFRMGQRWLVDMNNNGTFDNGVDLSYFLGNPGDQPVPGLW
jgi:hypothetical protein